MATSLVDLDVVQESGEILQKCIIDLAIEKQLRDMITNNRSTKNPPAKNPSTLPMATTCLLDVDEVSAMKSEPIQQISSFESAIASQLIDLSLSGSGHSTSDQPTSTLIDVSTTVDEVKKKREVVTNSVTSSEHENSSSEHENSSSEHENSSSEHENSSTNGTSKSLVGELKKTAIVLTETKREKSTDSSNSKETVIVFANPIGWMYEFSIKKNVRAPFFNYERLDSGHKVTCSFVGMKGEGIGRNSKIAKLKAAEDCLKHLNIAMACENIVINTFANEPKNKYKTTNFVGELYEHAQKFRRDVPRFECLSECPSLFIIACSYLSYRETATARSKKEAKTDAASKVYEKLMKDEQKKKKNSY